MKKILFVLAGIIMLCKTYAQDIIYKNDGTEINSIVTEITIDAIKYKNLNQPDGPIRNVSISDVFMIIYKDGTKEVFKGRSEEVKKQSKIQDSAGVGRNIEPKQVEQNRDNSNLREETNKPGTTTNKSSGGNAFKDLSDGRADKKVIYGKESPFQFNIGLGFSGPVVSIMSVFKNDAGELYFEYKAFDWEKNEDLINKPTSGGFDFGLNYYFSYVSHARFKWFLGLGGGNANERVGKTSFYKNEGWTGYWDYMDVCFGTRFFITKKIHINGRVGYLFNIDDSNTILKKYQNIISSDVKAHFGHLGLWLNISYTF